ncbi:TonB family protein [Orbaceae bacterium ESL0727]|nr:TonB family protein [Orbaceae bacterium ESL0727]
MNFDINAINIDIIDDIKTPIKAKKSSSSMMYSLVSIGAHLLFIGLLCSSLFIASNAVIKDEGDKEIRAIMVDLSKIAAPAQSLAEAPQEAKSADKTEQKVDEESQSQPEPQPQLEPEPKPEFVVKPDEKVAESVKPIEKPSIKPREKPVKKPVKDAVAKRSNQPPKPQPQAIGQNTTQSQARQDIVSDNVAPVSSAPAIANNNKYSEAPSPISRNQPEYPRRALDMRLEGYVVVRYDINSEGRVENIRFVESIPENVFNRAVVTAMRTWRYKPIAAKDLTIKIIFNRNQSISLSNS